MENLKLAINWTEKQTGYAITLKGDGPGRLLTGKTKGGKKLAFIYCDCVAQAVHELGHLLSTPGPRPISLLSMLIRELEAWRAAECLHDKFDIPFNEECFDEGISSYIFELVASEECPSYEWLSQLLGGEL